MIELTFWSKMNAFSRNLNHNWKCREPKKKRLPDNLDHNVMKLYSVLVQVGFATSKTNFDTANEQLNI